MRKSHRVASVAGIYLPRAGALLLLVLALLGGTGSVAAAHPSPAGAQAAAQAQFPDVIHLPRGWQPEGIATGRGTSFYTGSVSGKGIYRGDLRTGEGAVLVPPMPGRFYTGMKVDPRSNYLFVAGAGTGKAYVYDAATGAEIAVYQLAPAGDFINDVVITRDAGYFTDSSAPTLYRLPLGPAGAIAGAPAAIPLGGEWQQAAGFNANGIAATPDGRYLIVVNTTTGLLYRVDPATGVAHLIDLGGESVSFGDGLLLQGKTLYVVRNQLNEIVVFQMAPDFSAGTRVARITDSDFDVPTTIARFGDSLYAVNARFGIPAPASAAYEVVKVSR